MSAPDLHHLHACRATWEAKAAQAEDEANAIADAGENAGAHRSARIGYLSGRADAFHECADALGALLS